MSERVKATLVFLMLMGIGFLGCGGVPVDGADAPAEAAPSPTCQPLYVVGDGVIVGSASYDADGSHSFWSECMVCDGSRIARTWGPALRDGQTGPAVMSGPSCDSPSIGANSGDGGACAVSASYFAAACAPPPAVQ
jgi:hypothetical protein